MNLRTTTRHEDDLWPIATVWLPSAVLMYVATFHAVEWLLTRTGHGQSIPVEIVGGGASTTVSMPAASYYGGLVGITAMLAVFLAWFVRDELYGGATS